MEEQRSVLTLAPPIITNAIDAACNKATLVRSLE